MRPVRQRLRLHGVDKRPSIVGFGYPLTAFPPTLLLPRTYHDLQRWPQHPNNRKSEREKTFSTLNVLIEGLNLAKELSSATPAKATFGSVSALLVTIRVRLLPLCGNGLMAHVYLGLFGQPAEFR